MKHMGIATILLSSIIALTACGSDANKKAEKTSESVNAVVFTNGVTDANKGARKGPVELKGNIAFPSAKKVYLWATYGKTNTLIDSAAVNAGAWSFGTKERAQGIYMLGLADNNLTSIILNPSEAITEIGIRGARVEGAAYAINSKENEGWFAYLPKETAILKAIKDARVAMSKSSLKGEYEKQIATKEAELSKLQADMIGAYPNTHFAKLVTWKQEPTKTDIAKYWDNVDFTDQSLINGTVMSDRIQNFMRGFSKGTESGFINCVATVAEKAKADDVVLEFMLNQMLVGFYESGMENICTYIIDNYVNGDACGDADLSNIIKSTAESIQKISVGNTPPNIQYVGIDGKSVDLMKIAASKKYTLVMFWSSWCEHCKGEAPEVKQCYDLFKPKGFEIVGVSVDNVKSAWEAAVADRGFTFPNVCGMKLWESKAAKDYRVTKTPAFFLLDASGKIVLKPRGIREVQAFLNQNLK
ncbi:MAG: peroxiredoxin family protein [Flavobacteriales bacterium]|jgi:peroxiredoxin